jgi:hypothetical protein
MPFEKEIEELRRRKEKACGWEGRKKSNASMIRKS